MVPGYFGWIAAQFVALALLLELLFGIDPALGLLIVATVGTGYTLVGGMWSVVVTDALQAALLVIGLVVIAAAALLALGNGDVRGRPGCGSSKRRRPIVLRWCRTKTSSRCSDGSRSWRLARWGTCPARI